MSDYAPYVKALERAEAEIVRLTAERNEARKLAIAIWDGGKPEDWDGNLLDNGKWKAL